MDNDKANRVGYGIIAIPKDLKAARELTVITHEVGHATLTVSPPILRKQFGPDDHTPGSPTGLMDAGSNLNDFSDAEKKILRGVE